MIPNHYENLRQELRRGTLAVAVLGALRSERYGYTLQAALAEFGITIDQGTLYPLLRRLDSQGLLTSQWRTDGGRRKRFYKLSADGETVLELLVADLRSTNAALDRVFAADKHSA